MRIEGTIIVRVLAHLSTLLVELPYERRRRLVTARDECLHSILSSPPVFVHVLPKLMHACIGIRRIYEHRDGRRS